MSASYDLKESLLRFRNGASKAKPWASRQVAPLGPGASLIFNNAGRADTADDGSC